MRLYIATGEGIWVLKDSRYVDEEEKHIDTSLEIVALGVKGVSGMCVHKKRLHYVSEGRIYRHNKRIGYEFDEDILESSEFEKVSTLEGVFDIESHGGHIYASVDKTVLRLDKEGNPEDIGVKRKHTPYYLFSWQRRLRDRTGSWIYETKLDKEGKNGSLVDSAYDLFYFDGRNFYSLFFEQDRDELIIDRGFVPETIHHNDYTLIHKNLDKEPLIEMWCYYGTMFIMGTQRFVHKEGMVSEYDSGKEIGCLPGAIGRMHGFDDM